MRAWIWLDRDVGTYNTFDLSDRFCFPNKTKISGSKVFNMKLNFASKLLRKHILCDYRCIFDGEEYMLFTYVNICEKY